MKPVLSDLYTKAWLITVTLSVLDLFTTGTAR